MVLQVRNQILSIKIFKNGKKKILPTQKSNFVSETKWCRVICGNFRLARRQTWGKQTSSPPVGVCPGRGCSPPPGRCAGIFRWPLHCQPTDCCRCWRPSEPTSPGPPARGCPAAAEWQALGDVVDWTAALNSSRWSSTHCKSYVVAVGPQSAA